MTNMAYFTYSCVLPSSISHTSALYVIPLPFVFLLLLLLLLFCATPSGLFIARLWRPQWQTANNQSWETFVMQPRDNPSRPPWTSTITWNPALAKASMRHPAWTASFSELCIVTDNASCVAPTGPLPAPAAVKK